MAVDGVTAELEIIQEQLSEAGIRVTIAQLRSLSIRERVTMEQWAIGVLRSKKDSEPFSTIEWVSN